MAYSSTPKYSQSIQFTYNKTPYDSYNTAVRMVTKKNLLPGEPASCFYKNDEGELKMLLAIGTFHGYENPLILSENTNPAQIIEGINMLKDLIGISGEPTGDEIKIPVKNPETGEVVVLSNLIDATNYIYDLLGEDGLENVPEEFYTLADPDSEMADKEQPEKATIINNINDLLETVKNLLLWKEDLIIDSSAGVEDLDTKVYSSETIDNLFNNISVFLRYIETEEDENVQTINLGVNEDPVCFIVDGGEITF